MDLGRALSQRVSGIDFCLRKTTLAAAETLVLKGRGQKGGNLVGGVSVIQVRVAPCRAGREMLDNGEGNAEVVDWEREVQGSPRCLALSFGWWEAGRKIDSWGRQAW